MAFPEDLCGKDLEPGARAPAVIRQPGFARQMIEHCLTVPPLFGGDLGQEKGPAATLFQDDPMGADDNCTRSGNPSRRRQH